MAKLFALMTAAAALLVSVNAQCPPNIVQCGSSLINDHKCATLLSLRFFTDPDANPNDVVYQTDSTGTPVAPVIDYCDPGKCVSDTSSTAHCA